MSERPASALEVFYDEFLVQDDAPAASKVDRDIINAVHGDRLERGRDAVVGAVQESGALPIMAAGTMAASSVSGLLSPVLAAAHNLSRGALTSHRTERPSTTKNSHPDEVSFTLKPGGTIDRIGVLEAQHMGVSVPTADGEIEAENGIAPDRVRNLPVGMKIHVLLDRAIAVVPAGEGLEQVAKEHGLTLEKLLKLDPTYRTHRDLVEFGAHLRIRSSETPVSPKPTAKRTDATHHAHHKAQAPLDKPVISHPKAESNTLPTRHSHKHHAPNKASTTKAEVPVLPILPAAKPAAPAHVTKHAVAHRVAHHASHYAPKPSKPEATYAKATYDIHSNVLTKSGLSVAALRHALEQMYGSPMASLAGDFHSLEQKFGINALYGAAAAAQESGGATSYLARNRNNLYGINAVDSNPNLAFGYSSKAQSVTDFGKLLHKDYLHPGGQYWNGSTLHGIYTKYSSSHDTEAEEIASIMNSLARHGKDFYQTHPHVRTPKHAANGPGFLHDFGHLWVETQTSLGSVLLNSIKQAGQHTHAPAGHAPYRRPHHSHDKIKRHSRHTGSNASIYYAALKYKPASYQEAMIAGHEGVSQWHKDFPKIGPNVVVDCSGLVNLAVADATGGRVKLNENTNTERTDKKDWQKEPYSRVKRGDLIQPVIGKHTGNHVEIVNYVKGNKIYTFGAHTSHAPQHAQVGPAEYIKSSKDVFLRYVGPYAPLRNGVSHQNSTNTVTGHKHP